MSAYYVLRHFVPSWKELSPAFILAASLLSSDLYFHSIVGISLSVHTVHCQLDSMGALPSYALYSLHWGMSGTQQRLGSTTSPRHSKIVSDFKSSCANQCVWKAVLFKIQRIYPPANNFYVIRLPDCTLSFIFQLKAEDIFNCQNSFFVLTNSVYLLIGRRHHLHNS